MIGGILVAALYNPAERLDYMSAAIVNEDEPVEIDGQLVPLGRQLTAGLVEGSDEIASNLDWTISNADDAAEGLADGTYQAVVTIPENFSAAATSTAPGGTPEQAIIEVATPPDSKVVDDAITAQVTSAAASIMGTSSRRSTSRTSSSASRRSATSSARPRPARTSSPTARRRRRTARPRSPAARRS